MHYATIHCLVMLGKCFGRFKYSITGARFGGRTEAVRRVLAQLPISAQSYSTSPFLDLSLFSYDDKWVSAMERPKACGDHPIRYGFFLKFNQFGFFSHFIYGYSFLFIQFLALCFLFCFTACLFLMLLHSSILDYVWYTHSCGTESVVFPRWQ